LGNTEFLTSAQALNLVPAARTQGLRGAVRYWDGQFNDARLAIAIARTAAQEGALLVNYCRAERLLYEGTKVAGLLCLDARTGQSYPIRSRCVVNATGVWVDALRDTVLHLLTIQNSEKQQHTTPQHNTTQPLGIRLGQQLYNFRRRT